jgi:hypothetical protein
MALADGMGLADGRASQNGISDGTPADHMAVADDGMAADGNDGGSPDPGSY